MATKKLKNVLHRFLSGKKIMALCHARVTKKRENLKKPKLKIKTLPTDQILLFLNANI